MGKIDKIAAKLPRLVRIATILVWALLFALLLRRDLFIKVVDPSEMETLRQAKAEEYQGVYFKKDKIGYVKSSFTPVGEGDFQLRQQARMHLNVAQTVQVIELHLTATLGHANHLKDFNFTFQSPFYRMEAQGVVQENRIDYTLVTGSSTIKESLSFSTPPMLATSRRAYLLTKNLQPGEKRRIPWFDPLSLSAKESILEYKGKESILINGRVQVLNRFTELFSGTRINSWLNDSGVVVKEESPAGFIFLKEPKFKALADADPGEEILSAVAVKMKGELPERPGPRMQYRLGFPEDLELDLAGDRQQFSDNILTVTLEDIPTNLGLASCSETGDTLSASPYIQSDNDKITALSQNLLKDLNKNSSTISPTDKVKRLGTWVYEKVEKRAVLGMPDALATLENLQGDCNEHAALFAALARSAGIPTRVVAGVTHHKKGFYYHAWNEVCLGDSWISIDTTTNQFPADVTHLRFVVGEMQEQVRIGGLIGHLTIEPLRKKSAH